MKIFKNVLVASAMMLTLSAGVSEAATSYTALESTTSTEAILGGKPSKQLKKNAKKHKQLAKVNRRQAKVLKNQEKLNKQKKALDKKENKAKKGLK